MSHLIHIMRKMEQNGANWDLQQSDFIRESYSVYLINQRVRSTVYLVRP